MKELQLLPQAAELVLPAPAAQAAKREENVDEMPTLVQAAEVNESLEMGVQMIEQLIARIQEL